MEKKIYSGKNDPQFCVPVIDLEELRQRRLMDGSVVEYRHIHGHFDGTKLKFLFCFPEGGTFENRFFQHLSPFPGPDEELAALDKGGEDDMIGFALTHGSAYVESNMASSAIFGGNEDPTIIFRSSAAVAEFCRQTARERYGAEKVYGYVFGGSGGGYKTMSCIENTDAFDGAVPFVIGSPVSLPNCLTVAAHGARLLRHCWPKIVDALEPGGSGDPYAGLNAEEAEALREISRMGFPPRMCFTYAGTDDGALPVLTPGVKEMDPGYFTDFWEKPGYLGTQPNSNALRDRIHMRTKVVSAAAVNHGAAEGQDGRNGTDDAWQKMITDASTAYIEVEQVPQGEDLFLRGVDIIFASGAAAGRRLRLGSIAGNRLIPGESFGMDDFVQVIGSLRPGDQLLLDNSDYIAIQTYHRHQVPADRSFHAFDQYRNPDGTPKLPQRPYVISYGFTEGGCGSVQDGCVQGKVIVMNNLMDSDFPWQADWYRRKVEQTKGETWVRLWYNDNAPHGDISETGEETRMVSYLGMLRQALLDLSAWVEKGIVPAPSTGYRLEENQVVLDEVIEKRGGIQPFARLLANGGECAHVQVGQPVSFRAEIKIPPAAGMLELAEFSFEGERNYPHRGTVAERWQANGCACAVVEAEHSFSKPGTYFCVVRVTSNRNPGDGYTRLRNLCRVRVIVDEP